MNTTPRILVVQRRSMTDGSHSSRTIGARFAPLLSYMSKNGMIEWELIPDEHVNITVLNKFDFVLFNKHVSNHSLSILRMANELGINTIYDLDDWLLDLPSWSVLEMDEDILSNVTFMIREAKIATASNRQLKEKMERLRHSEVHIIQNGFDPRTFDISPSNWSESTPKKIIFSNLDGVKLIKFREDFFNVLSDFLNNNDVEIEFWGDPFPELPLIPKLIIRGCKENIAYKMAIRDRGYLFAIVPLGGEEDHDTLSFNSCKSPIKYVDYGSLGIPAIFSDCPTYRSEIRHGETGLLAKNNSSEWRSALNEMLSNSLLRQSIRNNSYHDVMQRFDVAYIAKNFLAVMSDV